MKLGSTGLTVRELQVAMRSGIELTPKQVSAWIEQLPAANLGESSQAIYRMLVDSNKTILEPDVRLRILNIIEPVALKLVDSLERQFINNHISLSDKQRKVAALVQALQTELSFGFHAVIESITSEGIKRSTKKPLALAICYAIKYHGLVILRCFQLYASVPSRVWRELYRLYKLAKQYQLENVKTIEVESGLSWSAKNFFSQILLLSISSPYQLRQSEIELVWNLLPDYVEFCSLEAHSYSKNPFLLNLNSNTPPVQKSLYVSDEAENKLKISVVAVVDKIKVDLAQVTEKAKYSARKTMVFKHLIHCWSHGTQRSFARTGCADEIYVTIGLGATHFLLTESLMKRQAAMELNTEGAGEYSEQTLEAMEGSLRDATIATVSDDRGSLRVAAGRNYLSTSAITSNDVWAKLYRPDQAIAEKETEKSITERSRDSIVRDSYKIQKSQLINMSPGGYCIQVSTTDLPKHAQTGEIIGFIEGDHDSHQWSLGIVRWVRRQVKGDFVQMGVQLLAPDVLPISLQLKNNRNETSQLQRALMLPALTGVGQEATIITNPLAFNLNNRLRVMEIADEYEVRLTKEISSSSSSKQFSFERLASKKQTSPPEKPQEPSEPKDMDGLWDLI
jgi:cyclic-di-GMP-binding protein